MNKSFSHSAEIRQDIEKQTALQKQEMILATSLDSANLNGQDSLNISRVDGLQEFDSSYSESSSLDLFDFVKNFMEKNVGKEVFELCSNNRWFIVCQ